MSTATKGTALITGAPSGIGAVYAEGLAHQGYDLIPVVRTRERLDTIASRLGRSVKVAPLVESGIAKMDRMIGLNAKARVHLRHAVAPAMVRRKAGSIVNTAPELLNGVKGGVKAFGLEGFAQGEVVTIPSPPIIDWTAYEMARQAMIPKLSLSSPAPRYGIAR